MPLSLSSTQLHCLPKSHRVQSMLSAPLTPRAPQHSCPLVVKGAKNTINTGQSPSETGVTYRNNRIDKISYNFSHLLYLPIFSNRRQRAGYFSVNVQHSHPA